MKKVLCLFCLLLFVIALAPASLFAQGSYKDYERATSLDQRTRNKVFRTSVKPNWSDSGDIFWYRMQTGPAQYKFVYVYPLLGIRRPAFDHAQLAKTLADKTGEAVDATNLPFTWIHVDDSGQLIRFKAFNKSWQCGPDGKELSESPEEIDSGQGLTASARPRPSRRTGEESSIHFINKTEKTIDLFWIDSSGNRKKYGSLKPGESRDQHTYEGHVWLAADQDGKTLSVFECAREPGDAVIDGNMKSREEPSGPSRPRERGVSPDGAWVASSTDSSVRIKNTKNGEEITLCEDGSEENHYTSRFYWSPDSKKLVVMQIEKGEERTVYLIESSPEDQLQPKLHSYSYNKPGDKMPVPRPRLFDIEKRKKIEISDELFPNAWSINDIHWWPDSSEFVFTYNQRGHQVLRIVGVNAENGNARAVVDEQSKTFVDYAGKQYKNNLDETREIIWMSERDGWNHLYLYDARTGAVKNQITRGEWVVRNVERVDVEKRQIWFSAGGVYPDQDPYYVHLCRANFDGSGFTVLTQANGTYQWEFSPNKEYFIDTWSRVDQPPVTELRLSENGNLISDLECADWSKLLAEGWRPPERFVAKGRDGVTDIYGIIFRPSNFDINKTYPVIEEIYAGPHSSHVPKKFERFVRQSSMAELGFIVVQIDGMGTSNRSKAFHDVCWKNLGDAGFPDRILWMKAAAKKYPQMDLSRVGIYGGSAGGQNALRALLAHGDFYKVAVTDCGCHDNRMDKIWWNELWMGWPVGPHYEEQSNVTQAHKLEGKLLLIVGELDRNVDPASTMQVANALVKSDKDFDLLVIPGAGHGSAESPYGKRRRMDFFVRHLHKLEPRWGK